MKARTMLAFAGGGMVAALAAGMLLVLLDEAPDDASSLTSAGRRRLTRRVSMAEKSAFWAKHVDLVKKLEAESGVPWAFSLAQAGLESGYGKNAYGNNYFGVKAGSRWKGRKQLLWTWEYHTRPDVSYPEIKSVVQQGDRYLYRCKDWFRVYETPEDSFRDHDQVLKRSWPKAFATRDPKAFARVVSGEDGGLRYATAPHYYETVCQLIDEIVRWEKGQAAPEPVRPALPPATKEDLEAVTRVSHLQSWLERFAAMKQSAQVMGELLALQARLGQLPDSDLVDLQFMPAGQDYKGQARALWQQATAIKA